MKPTLLFFVLFFYSATSIIAQPTITNITGVPISTTGGAITISGSNFGVSGSVTVGGITASLISYTNTTITCNAPAGTGVNKPVVVTTGAQSSSPFFVNYQAPSITSITGNPIPAAGGVITIIGTNFGTTGFVTINGIAATISSHTHTSITCTAPAGTGINKPVIVTVGGQSSNSFLVSYQAPTILTIAGTPIPAAGGSITISGSNFGTSGSVTVGGIAASVVSYTNTSIVCTAPAGTGINKPVIVTAGGQNSNSFLVSYQAPTITTITGTPIPTAGGVITINGSNFGTTGSITVDGIAASIVSYSNTSITCNAPPGSGVNKPVVVTVGGQTSNSSSVSYQTPSISIITGSPIPTAGGVITINGSNFGTIGSVTIDGTAATISSHTHTSITCTAPAGTGINKPVIVTVGGQSSNAVFVSYQAPIISVIIPTLISTAGGDVLSIAGSNFGASGTSIVTIDGVPVTVLSNTHTSLTCTTLPGTGVNKPVVVTVGGQSSNAFLISYKAPFISTITPNSGPSSGGTVLSVAGTNFGNNPAQVTVTIGSFAATNITLLSHTALTCTVPPGYGMELPVRVTVAGQASNSETFTYNTSGNIGIGTNSPSNFLSIAGHTDVGGNLAIGKTSATTNLDVEGGIRTAYSGSVVVNIASAGVQTVNLPIGALPSGWTFQNTAVVVSNVQGSIGVIRQATITSGSNIQLNYDAISTGTARFNYVIFKL